MSFALPKDDSIPDFLDRRPFVGTYSNLNGFRNCEHQFYRRYIKKDQIYVQSPEAKWGDDIHVAFEHRIGSKVPLPAAMHQWENFAAPFDAHLPLVEQKLGMTAKATETGYWDGDCWFRGKADCVVLKLDKQMAYIADWKSGGSKYEDPFELATNALLLKMRYPELKKVVGSYAWLKENRMGQQYDVSDFKRTFIEVQRLMNLVASKRVSGEWIKRKSGLCSYCSVKDCENWREAKK